MPTDLPYITRLELRDVYCFATLQRFDFTTDDGQPAMWNVLLGENGTGKTTALQALAAITIERGLVELIFLTGNVSKTRQQLIRVTQGKRVGEFEPANSHKPLNDDKLFAYGALRRINVVRMIEGEQQATFGYETLFDDAVGLGAPAEWLIQADYVAKVSGNERDKMHLKRVKDVLARVLPDVGNAENIIIDVFVGKPGVQFVTPYGQVPSSRLSSGYRSMAAWVVDLAGRMLDRYPESEDPLAEPAVVLVDEFDLHLHPSWQRQAIGHLRACFPRTQFIVTAHSPLIVQELPESSTIHVLRRVGDHVEVTRHPNVVRTWRVDQLLTSDLFDLDGARSTAVTADLERRAALRAKKRRTKAERAELEALDKAAEALPTEATQEDMEAAALVRETAALIRERGIAPELSPPASLLAKLRGDKA